VDAQDPEVMADARLVRRDVSEGLSTRRARLARRALAAFALAIVLWLVLGAFVGTPGPGPLRRYSVSDLREAERIAHDLGSWDGEYCRPSVRVDFVFAHLVVVLGETPDVGSYEIAEEELRAALHENGLHQDIVMWPEDPLLGFCSVS
jgi:hypothetical protein